MDVHRPSSTCAADGCASAAAEVAPAVAPLAVAGVTAAAALTEVELLTDSLERARRAGLTGLAADFAQKLKSLQKERRIKTIPLGEHLQQLSEMRRAKEEAERKEEKEKRRPAPINAKEQHPKDAAGD